MRVTREKSAQHRAAIVRAAADLFRARGLKNVGVAEIMQAAGLTHGGFYGHFDSKDALAAEACRAAFDEGLQRVAASDEFKTYVAHFCSPAHRERRLGGCPMVSLGSEIRNQEPVIQAKFAEGIADYLAGVEALVRRSEPDLPAAAARAKAIASVSAMVGGMIMARATAQAQPALSDEILETLSAAIAH